MSDDWKEDLRNALTARSAPDISHNGSFADFLQNTVVPAYHQIDFELRKHGRDVKTRVSEASASISVLMNGTEELVYRVQGRVFPHGVLPYAEIRFRERNGLRLITVEQMIRSGKSDYRLEDVSVQDVINHFLQEYTKRTLPC